MPFVVPDGEFSQNCLVDFSFYLDLDVTVWWVRQQALLLEL